MAWAMRLTKNCFYRTWFDCMNWWWRAEHKHRFTSYGPRWLVKHPRRWELPLGPVSEGHGINLIRCVAAWRGRSCTMVPVSHSLMILELHAQGIWYCSCPYLSHENCHGAASWCYCERKRHHAHKTVSEGFALSAQEKKGAALLVLLPLASSHEPNKAKKEQEPGGGGEGL